MVAALALASVAQVAAPAAAQPETVRYIVGFEALDEVQAQAGEYEGAPVLKANRAIDFLVVETADPGFPVRARDDPRVRYVEEAPLLRWIEADKDMGALLTPDDPRFSEMYGPQPARRRPGTPRWGPPAPRCASSTPGCARPTRS